MVYVQIHVTAKAMEIIRGNSDGPVGVALNEISHSWKDRFCNSIQVVNSVEEESRMMVLQGLRKERIGNCYQVCKVSFIQ